MTSFTTDKTQQADDYGQDGYGGFLVSFGQKLNAASGPLFTTNIDDLFTTFLENLPPENRQHYNCNACRRFVDRFGALVTIQPDGTTRSLFWQAAVEHPFFTKAIIACGFRVEKAKVTGVFLSSDTVWGQPLTAPWRHMAASHVPAAFVYKPVPRTMAGGKVVYTTADQIMAERREEYGMLGRGLVEFTAPVAKQALALLKSGTLYRSEKCEAIAQWFVDLHEAIARTRAENPINVVWRAVATAPAGFAHVRSTMIGTLLEDILTGYDTASIARRFAEKMSPDQYQRPIAAPSAGQITAAERAVEALGVVPALARRYARDADLSAPGAVIWSTNPVERAAPPPRKASGVFDHLKPPAPAVPQIEIPPRLVTWEKFARDFLPGIAELRYRVPQIGSFAALTTAQDVDAPPILQWDRKDRPNAVSWSFPFPAASAEEWSLQAGADVPVRMVVTSPNLWGGEQRFLSHGKGVFLLLDGARDKRNVPGGGFFPEHLNGELAPYRATIEAHANKLVLTGADDPTACFGVGFFAGGKWTEQAAPRIGVPAAQEPVGQMPRRIHVILLIDNSPSMASYLAAGRRAVRSIVDAIRALPGTVDVSVHLFGARQVPLYDRVSVGALYDVEKSMDATINGTALDDTIGSTLENVLQWADAGRADTSFFLGLVTDGGENASIRYQGRAGDFVRRALATGRWTIAFAGAGSDGKGPRHYARSIGIPDGNVAVFEASSAGFDEVGARFASSTAGLARAYASGKTSSTSFFAAATAREPIGTDHPVLLATMRSGEPAAFTLDRWE